VFSQTLAAVNRRVADTLHDSAAADLFGQCLERTIHRAVRRLDDDTVFVVTGDIPAMWLRDSAAQMWPYVRICQQDEALQDLVAGVLARQLRCILTDAYANAFNASPDGRGGWVWERKYELDSLCYPLDLAYRFWKTTGRVDHFDGWYRQASERIVTLWTLEQDHESRSPYRFRRLSRPLMRRGRGRRTAATGMTWSGFRPSDDACRYGYHVPGNMFAVVVLRQLARIATEVLGDDGLAQRALRLAPEIDTGITVHGVIDHPVHGRVYAYEVDGTGRTLLMDDANVPSLLAAPLLGYVDADDPVYQATRRFVLSDANPYYFAGRAAAGVGSPHTARRHVWPIALAVEGLTTTEPAEQRALIDTLCRTAIDGAVHESFHCDRPQRYTRDWFSWADAMYCELVLAHCGVGPARA
jgi:meiotically up-regulated gene 157 (Mug157) protein